MLALTGLGAGGGARTMVFDEIDAGIGGNTARAVGERLRELGAERQVICITHLPQVASLANAHFRIAKESGADGRRGDGGAGRTATSSSPRSCACSAPSATTRSRSRHARELLAAA